MNSSKNVLQYSDESSKVKMKVWIKPEMKSMNISKDTFSGTKYGAEEAGKGGPPYPPGPPPKY